MEAGLLKKPLLLNDQTKPSTTENVHEQNGNGGGDCRVTPLVVLSTSAAVFGSFVFGCSVGYSSVTQSAIMEELGLSVAAYSVFGSIMTFGGMIGAVISGKIADLLGRRQTMWFTEIFCIFGWLAIAFAKDAWWLDLGRLSLGIGVGLFSYVIPVYIAEITPKTCRGGFTFANQLMMNCGISLVYILGNIILWRTLALLCVVPCFLQVICLFFIPESPRWLAKHGREKEFKAALQRLRGKNADISEEAFAIKETAETLEINQSKFGFFELFERRYALSLVVGVGLMFLQQLSGCSGISYYSGIILTKAGFSSSIGTTALAIILIPKALMGLIIVDKMGRRPLLMISAALMCLCSLLVGFSFWMQGLHYMKELTPILAFIGLVGYITANAIGMGGLPWVIMSEIFPMNVKASAGSLVTLANWSTGWLVTYTFNFMLQWSPIGTFYTFAGISGATIVFIWTLVPETKGRTLEEIHASFSNIVR